MSKKHSKMSLPVQMVIGLVLGVIVGSMTSAEFTAAYLRPFGQLFITLIRMVVVPLVLATIIAGAAGIHDLSKLGRVATKTLVYYFLTTGVAVAIGLFLANIMQPGIGLDLSTKGLEAKQITPPSLIQTLLNIVPMNPIDALAKGNMLQVIFFAVIFGFALSSLGETGKPLLRIFELIGDVMIRMTNMVMMYAPIGVFGLISYTVSQHGLKVLLPLGKLILVSAIASVLHVIICYSPLVKYVVRIPLPTFFRGVFEPWLIAFTTCSSAAALPTNLQSVRRLGASKGVASFSIPLGNTHQYGRHCHLYGRRGCFRRRSVWHPADLERPAYRHAHGASRLDRHRRRPRGWPYHGQPRLHPDQHPAGSVGPDRWHRPCARYDPHLHQRPRRCHGCPARFQA